MNRTTLARRYAPLLAVVAVQLLIIASVPSKAPSQVAAAGVGKGVYGGGSTGAGSDPAAAGGDVGAGGGTLDPATGAPLVGGGAGGGAVGGGGTAAGGGGAKTGASTAGGGAAGAAAGTGAKAGAGAAAAGDTSHCVAGRQYDAKVDFYAPPCLPKFAGDNGGATYRGVTKDTIKVVDYYDKGNDAVNAILKASGSYVSIDQLAAYDKVAETFINSHYELYGRKVQIKVVGGSCQSIPPDVQCLRKEFDDIIAAENPFAIKWDTSLCSACYDEISQKKVLNVGGYSFRDEFSAARRPYHWDTFMSGTKLATNFAQWYCANLAGKPARYAGTQNPADQINGRTRVLGVISTNDPENQGSVQLLDAALKKGCGASVAHTYFYAQDITSAEQQRAAGVSAMRSAPESTSVLCLCDEVAPQFLYEEEQQENYYPENLIDGSESMDLDRVAQTYEQNPDGSSSLACPAPQVGCEYDNVIGLAIQPQPQEALYGDAGSRVWKAGGGQGQPPFPGVSRTWDYLNLIASLIQAAGPHLTPADAESGIFSAPGTGGTDTGHPLRKFAPGNYGWVSDMVPVYWSKTKMSPYNGKPGHYVPLGGRVKSGSLGATDLSPIPADIKGR